MFCDAWHEVRDGLKHFLLPFQRKHPIFYQGLKSLFYLIVKKLCCTRYKRMACIQYVFDSAELIRLIAQTSNRILAMYKNMAFHLKLARYLVFAFNTADNPQKCPILSKLTGMRSSMSF